jgi:pseudaminic acid biosynthesis-associated methylase
MAPIHDFIDRRNGVKNFKTPQESFWAGEFGDEYSTRVDGEEILASYTAMHADILRRTREVGTILEFGANIGLNLRAYRCLLPKAELSAIELNPTAFEILRSNKDIKNVYHQSILEFEPDYQRDLVLIKTVLIHINPDALNEVYDRLYRASKRYICVAEYYSPTPVTVEYRGHSERLFKRDFAGEILDRFPDLKLVDYGFVYHRDTSFPIGDVTWFLMEKC